MTPASGRRGRSSQPLSLKARAVALLAQREHSAMELRRKLLRIARDRRAAERAAAAEAAGLGVPGAFDPSGAVGANGDEVGFLSDHGDDAIDAVPIDEEVEAVLAWLKANGYLDESRFVESRIHVRSQRFGQRRIEQELAQHGLSIDAEQRAALSSGELDRACEMLRRKFGEGRAADAAAEAKRMRFLIGRGFGSDVVRRALRRVAEEGDVAEDPACDGTVTDRDLDG